LLDERKLCKYAHRDIYIRHFATDAYKYVSVYVRCSEHSEDAKRLEKGNYMRGKGRWMKG